MKIDFFFETQYGKFADAIILPDDHTFSEAEIEVSKQICNVRNALDVRQLKLVKGISHSQDYLSSSSVSKLQAEMAELEAQLADLEATMKTHRAKRRAADKNKKQCEWPCLV